MDLIVVLVCKRSATVSLACILLHFGTGAGYVSIDLAVLPLRISVAVSVGNSALGEGKKGKVDSSKFLGAGTELLVLGLAVSRGNHLGPGTEAKVSGGEAHWECHLVSGLFIRCDETTCNKCGIHRECSDVVGTCH
jgi:hypothetical protein